MKKVAILFGLVMVMVAIGAMNRRDAQVQLEQAAARPAPAPPPERTQEQKNAQVAAELQEQAAVVGVRDLVSRTYEGMRDKRSMEIQRVTTRLDGKTLTTCMGFTAKNGFGGVNEGSSVWQITAGKNQGLFAVDNNGAWNKHCAHTKGVNRTSDALETLAYLRSRG